ncbi:MAG: hypothetical protein V1716_01300 [Candidatus Uhrbacteria bacterium]
MERIKNQTELLRKLKVDIKNCQQNKVLFLGGHFPLLYSKNNKMAVEGLFYWGKFSLYTLELACKIGKYAREIGKQVEFVFFVDDHAYEEVEKLHSNDLKKRRDNLYKLRSGKNTTLPFEYKKILNKYGFSETNILRHDHGKEDRHDCLYFSEKILRASTRKIDNVCAREYTEFLENPKYFDKEQTYLIAFIPNRCQGHVCNVALANEVKNLKSSHVFMETLMPTLNKKNLFEQGRGVTYRKE